MDNQPKMKTMIKGWGKELWVINTPLYCGKLLTFNEGKQCSLHYHKIKDETFYIHSGLIELKYCDDGKLKYEGLQDLDLDNMLITIMLHPGDNFYIPPGRVHQMKAFVDSEMYEFSTQHFDSDSYRIIKGD